MGQGGLADISFTVPSDDLPLAVESSRRVAAALGASGVSHDDGVSKVSVVAAGMLQRGGAVSMKPLGIVVLACFGFAVSDLYIVALIDYLGSAVDASGEPLSRLHAGGLAMAVTFITCGVVAMMVLVVSPPLRPRDRRDRIAAVQYAATWLGGMVALYACFGLVGAVFGNVLQATRGVMAIVIGAALARAGWHDLEERVDRATFLRRFAAGCLMVTAIAISMFAMRS